MAKISIIDTGYVNGLAGTQLSDAYRANLGDEIELKGITFGLKSSGNYDNSPTLNSFSHSVPNFGSIENNIISMTGILNTEAQEGFVSDSSSNVETSVSYVKQKTILINKYITVHKNQIRVDETGDSGTCKVVYKYDDSTSKEVVSTTTSLTYESKTYINPKPSKFVDEIEVWTKVNSSSDIIYESSDQSFYTDNGDLQLLYQLSRLPHTVGYKICYYNSLTEGTEKQLVTMMSNYHALNSSQQTAFGLSSAFYYIKVVFTGFSTTQTAGSDIIRWSLDAIQLPF